MEIYRQHIIVLGALEVMITNDHSIESLLFFHRGKHKGSGPNEALPEITIRLMFLAERPTSSRPGRSEPLLCFVYLAVDEMRPYRLQLMIYLNADMKGQGVCFEISLVRG